MSTPMKPEREAEIRELAALESHTIGEAAQNFALREILAELDRLRATANLAAAVALESAAQHMCVHDEYGDPSSCTECDWKPTFRATDAEKREQWIKHVCSLLPDAQNLLDAQELEWMRNGRDTCAAYITGFLLGNQKELLLEGRETDLLAALDAHDEGVRKQERGAQKKMCGFLMILLNDKKIDLGVVFRAEAERLVAAYRALPDKSEEDNE